MKFQDNFRIHTDTEIIIHNATFRKTFAEKHKNVYHVSNLNQTFLLPLNWITQNCSPKNLTYTDTKLSGTGLAAAHNVSTLAIKALYIIELPGPYDSFSFSFRNALAIIVPGK
jgi:hypothetical protein